MTQMSLVAAIYGCSVFEGGHGSSRQKKKKRKLDFCLYQTQMSLAAIHVGVLGSVCEGGHGSSQELEWQPQGLLPRE